MAGLLDNIVTNATNCEGACQGCPATQSLREDGTPRSHGVNPGLGHSDAQVMFVTIEPSPAHGKLLNWDAYDWYSITTSITRNFCINGIPGKQSDPSSNQFQT